MLSCNSRSNIHPLPTRTRADIGIDSPTLPHATGLQDGLRRAILIAFYSPCLEDLLVEAIRLEGMLVLHPGIRVRIRIPLREPPVDGTTRAVTFLVVGTMISIDPVLFIYFIFSSVFLRCLRMILL